MPADGPHRAVFDLLQAGDPCLDLLLLAAREFRQDFPSALI